MSQRPSYHPPTGAQTPHQKLDPLVFAKARDSLNVTMDYVYEECSQNPIGQVHVILTGGSTMKQSMYDLVQAMLIDSTKQ